MTKPEQAITAYSVTAEPLQIETGKQQREWMDNTIDRFAYRCLPLVIANQAGWDLLCPCTFTAEWNGLVTADSVSIDFADKPSPMVTTHFGSGVLTFSVGYLMQTPPQTNLWIRGPVNMPKDGISPLEGLFEADWAPYTFTMNWKFTRANHPVSFTEGEPICRIFPMPRHYLESFQPAIKSVNDNPDFKGEYDQWNAARTEFIQQLGDAESDAAREKWQRSYMKGAKPDGAIEPDHQSKLHLKPFIT